MLSTNADVCSFQLLMNAPSGHFASQLVPVVPPTGSVYFAGRSTFGAGRSGLLTIGLDALLPLIAIDGSTASASAGGFPKGEAVGASVAGVTGSPARLHASEGLHRQPGRCESLRDQCELRTRPTAAARHVHAPTVVRIVPDKKVRADTTWMQTRLHIHFTLVEDVALGLGRIIGLQHHLDAFAHELQRHLSQRERTARPLPPPLWPKGIARAVATHQRTDATGLLIPASLSCAQFFTPSFTNLCQAGRVAA
jgi:hypothetical protein